MDAHIARREFACQLTCMAEFTQTSLSNAGTDFGNSAQPEFVDFHGLRRIFGIPRSTAYELIESGEIRSVSLRKKGHVKGRRLIDCESVRKMFARYSSSTASGQPAIQRGVQGTGESAK